MRVPWGVSQLTQWHLGGSGWDWWSGEVSQVQSRSLCPLAHVHTHIFLNYLRFHQKSVLHCDRIKFLQTVCSSLGQSRPLCSFAHVCAHIFVRYLQFHQFRCLKSQFCIAISAKQFIKDNKSTGNLLVSLCHLRFSPVPLSSSIR